MTTKYDLQCAALSVGDVTETPADSFSFTIKGKAMIWFYPERAHPW